MLPQSFSRYQARFDFDLQVNLGQPELPAGKMAAARQDPGFAASEIYQKYIIISY
jgi:hypothetical protein